MHASVRVSARARARACVCKDKGVRLPGAVARGPSMFLPLGEVTGCLGLLEAELETRGGKTAVCCLALSLSKLFFPFFLFFFLRLVAHAMSRCRFCTGMLCGPEYRCRGSPSPAKRANPGGHGTLSPAGPVLC